MSWQSDLNYGLAAFGLQIPERVSLDDWAVRLRTKPAQSTAAIVAASSVLFFMAERDHNPKVRDIYDAMIYCSTCLSVGYGDIFARTPVGKLIGTTLMSLGPAMTGATLDGVRDPKAEQVQEQILVTLQQLLAQCRVG